MTETSTSSAGFIKKRDGRSERYDGAKIVEAMRHAFEDVAGERAAARGSLSGYDASAPVVLADELEALLADVERAMARDAVDCVEGIQDLVERALMERGHFDVAKSYILYRHERAEKRAIRLELARAVAGLDGEDIGEGGGAAVDSATSADAGRNADVATARPRRTRQPARRPPAPLPLPRTSTAPSPVSSATLTILPTTWPCSLLDSAPSRAPARMPTRASARSFVRQLSSPVRRPHVGR